MIAVCIATYNHERYIAQCLESVLMQQCDEPIRIYIGDDASTDGTETVCQRFAAQDKRIVYLRRAQNMGLSGNTLDLYRRILADGCAYIAMLDGDDYWTEPKKLKLQIDHLCAHPECGFVHTGGRVLSGAKTWTFEAKEGIYGLQGASFANCTVLFRASLLSEELIAALESQHFLWLDYPLYGVFHQGTQWAFLPVETAVWRDHESVSQPTSTTSVMQLREERVRMWKWLDTRYPGQVGYSNEEADDYLMTERLNLIYTSGDKSLFTPDLIHTFHPRSVKLRIKQIGLKHPVLFWCLRLITKTKSVKNRKNT
jgi:glycosyltransferase involved in cell wall biosynthesis